MAELKTIQQDILTVKRGAIIQQVNCQGVMGAGLAKDIANKWPEVKLTYHDYFERQKWLVYSPERLLGRWCQCLVEPELYVVMVFGQVSYGSGQCHTRYMSLIQGIQMFSEYAKEILEADLASPLPLYVPDGIGCGLAGGSWSVVRALLEQETPNVIVCRKPI